MNQIDSLIIIYDSFLLKYVFLLSCRIAITLTKTITNDLKDIAFKREIILQYILFHKLNWTWNFFKLIKGFISFFMVSSFLKIFQNIMILDIPLTTAYQRDQSKYLNEYGRFLSFFEAI